MSGPGPGCALLSKLCQGLTDFNQNLSVYIFSPLGKALQYPFE